MVGEKLWRLQVVSGHETVIANKNALLSELSLLCYVGISLHNVYMSLYSICICTHTHTHIYIYIYTKKNTSILCLAS